MDNSSTISLPGRLSPAEARTVSQSSIEGSSFVHFLWKERTSRLYLGIALAASIVQFVLFKLLYPFPDFLSDSYSYIFAAYAHLGVSIWPIGYSKFLAAVHRLTWSDTALVGVQYVLVQLSMLWFFSTLRYFYQLSKPSATILLLFLFVNPLSLYICNTVNSDALFAALSLCWLTQLIWIIQRPRIHQLVFQAVLLFLCFTVRNNAYYYPLVALLAFVLIRQKLWFKVTGVLLPLLLIIPFVIFTQNKAFQLTGSRQYSFFTGWQLANNALYIYDQIEVADEDLPTPQARDLNRITTQFFKRVNPAVYRDYLTGYVGNFFIKQPDAPLKQYFFQHYKPKGELQYVSAWGQASADFEPFGKAIILGHPLAFIQYFVFPNMKNYIMPPLSNLEVYNYGSDSVWSIGQSWFHYPSPVVRSFSKGFQGVLLMLYTAFFLLFNGYFAWNVYQFARKKGFGDSKMSIGVTLMVVTGFIILNFAFSITATINILRYQFVPMIVLLAFSLAIGDYLEGKANNARFFNPKYRRS